MSEPFLGEIRMLGFGWAPQNWAICDGRSMPVQQNAALYSLLGVQFGGVQNTNFNLPDLRGRAPLGSTGVSNQGKAGGTETVTLVATQTPPHTHAMNAISTTGNQTNPTGNFYATPAVSGAIYATPTNTVALDGGTLTPVGGAAAHNNMQPFQVINFCICLVGIYPQRT